LNFGRDSELYSSITELLKAKSEHFASTIEKQVYIYEKKEEDVLKPSEVYLTSEKAEARIELATDREHSGAKQDAAVKTLTASKKKEPASKKQNYNNEPSLKWRALGLSEQKNASSSHRGRKKKGEGKKADRSSALKDRKLVARQNSFDEEEFQISDSDKSDEDNQDSRNDSNEFSAEYYQIQKLVKYLRCGNPTATIIAICALRDFDLNNDVNQLAIRDIGGLETLVNLLDTDNPKCKVGALKILKEIAKNVQIRASIAELDGIRPLVELLRDTDDEVKCLAAETIAHCAKNAQNRRDVRRYGGIRKLVRLLKAKPGSKEEETAISGACALATCSKSSKNKEAIQEAGSIPLLANLLTSQNERLLIPVVGILQECASDGTQKFMMII
jgi:hypothetical protein